METNNRLLFFKPLADNSRSETVGSELSTDKASLPQPVHEHEQDDDRPPVVFRRKLPKIRIRPKRHGGY